ncbi:hypothetical protein [Salibacterium aidingense]|nr:hypothetical protein [Salibacterium aidingense]
MSIISLSTNEQPTGSLYDLLLLEVLQLQNKLLNLHIVNTHQL